MSPCPERVEALANRAVKLAGLRRSERAERKLGIVLFGFPPNAGAVGTAAYLSVFESLFNTLNALHSQGYKVELPDSVEALRKQLLEGNAAQYGQQANVAARISADRIVSEDPHLAEVEAQWGSAPGKAQADGSGVFVLGASFGNVFVGVQPAFGYEGRFVLFTAICSRISVRMCCCISACTERWNSCQVSRLVCLVIAGRTV